MSHISPSLALAPAPLALPTAATIPAGPQTGDVQIPPAVQRVGEFIGGIAVGALAGYIGYWITRLIARLGMLGKLESGAIHPLPYILSGIISAALVETARLTYDVALYALGDRNQYENLANPANASTSDRLRQRAWKVIARVEKLEHDIDVIYSRIFNVRTEKEFRDNYLSRDESFRDKYSLDEMFYLSKPKFMEIVRRAFCEQVPETIKTVLPQELGIYAVEAMGYTILGGHLFLWLHGIIFLNGVIDKVGKVYQRVMKEERAEINRRELENQMYNDLLSALYPDEFAELEAGENNKAKAPDAAIPDVPVKKSEESDKVVADDMQLDDVNLVKALDFDPAEYEDMLAYRHTVFQSIYPMKGFPINEDPQLTEEEEIELELAEDDDVVIEEIEEADLPDNFAFVELG